MDNAKSWDQLIKTMKRFRKETKHQLYIFTKKRQKQLQKQQQLLTQQNVRKWHLHMMRSVLLHKQEVLTVQLHCSTTSIMCTLSY